MRRHRTATIAVLALLAAAGAPLAAQEAETGPPQMDPEMMAMMEAFQKAGTPGEPHEAMAASTGNWKVTIKSWMDPAAPPMISQGSAERAMELGGRVLEEKFVGDMMGQTFHGVGRRGYDNVTGMYWATWTDSMSTGVFVARGTADEKGAIVMRGEMDDPMTGEKVPVRSVHHPEKDGREVFEWYEDRGAGEVKTMEIVYQRAGS